MVASGLRWDLAQKRRCDRSLERSTPMYFAEAPPAHARCGTSSRNCLMLLEVEQLMRVLVYARCWPQRCKVCSSIACCCKVVGE